MSIDLSSYKLFLIDMDDTLYAERDYVLSGFRAVADALGRRGIDPEKAWQYLQHRFDTVGRDRIFDHLLCDLLTGEVGDADVADCVAVYRQHTPQIALYAHVDEVLRALRKRGRLVVVTDGLPAVQKRKFAVLGLDQWVEDLICCWDYAPKPDPQAIASMIRPGQRDVLLIGDDPQHDLPMAEAMQIDCVRVLTGRFAEMTSAPCKPIAEIGRFAALSGALGIDTTSGLSSKGRNAA